MKPLSEIHKERQAIIKQLTLIPLGSVEFTELSALLKEKTIEATNHPDYKKYPD